ncbi:MAG: hypothetical protein A2Y65_05275 [Deltaproteobacteria bacterium RBG_13_52_11]|nr:MAG: hypothetical protein A2Y65_05275 [Deltaproteobacteria bacterium RBG_13_52_11]
MKSPPQILAIDIGAGTQDILLYNARREEENNPLLVLPSPSGVWARRLEGIAADLFIHGDTIGGGRIGSVLRGHSGKGYRVSMTAEAARSIRDDLDQVREMGIEVVEDKPTGFGGEVLELQEVNIPFIQEIFGALDEGKGITVIALAVQDHGSAAQGESDRVFRFSCLRRTLEEGKGFAGFTYLQGEIPSYYHRMLSAAHRAKRESGATIMLMDTALSAILGAKGDEGTQVAVNIGNGHTIMALVIEGELQGFFEHHTALLTPAKLRDYILRFPRGEVSHEEIFAEGGHGAFLLTKTHAPATITVTGPKRGMMRETGLSYALPAPGGAMMMTGPWGLVKGARMRGLL